MLRQVFNGKAHVECYKLKKYPDKENDSVKNGFSDDRETKKTVNMQSNKSTTGNFKIAITNCF